MQLASNEKLLRQVVDSVSCGDGEEYRAAIAELKLNDYCYLLCHWVYSIVYHRVCEVVCSPERLFLGDAVSEIRAARKEIAGVLKNEKAFDAISKAAVALDSETLKSTIDQFGLGSQCGFICRVICSWRYVWVCREFCQLRTPVFTGADGIEEAQNFALASRQLASQPRALADLVSAVQNRDTKTYGAIIDRFGLGAYCYQVCAWVCSVTCYEFCIRVCPQPGPRPLFTNVGNFLIYGDIDTSTGLTSTQLLITASMPYGGGPHFAFYDQLQLGGKCPTTSPTFPGVQMMYRFLYAKIQTTLAAPGISSASQTSINVASSVGAPPTPFNVSVCYPDGPFLSTVEIMQVTNVSATTWTVVRGVDGTTAAASVAAGATAAVNPVPITGNLVYPVQVGYRPCPVLWPSIGPGFTAAIPIVPNTPQEVWIVPPLPAPPNPPFTAPSDPTPPPLTTTYAPPKHYITPDANGWIPVDLGLPSPVGLPLLGFNSNQATPGPCELPPPMLRHPGRRASRDRRASRRPSNCIGSDDHLPSHPCRSVHC